MVWRFLTVTMLLVLSIAGCNRSTQSGPSVANTGESLVGDSSADDAAVVAAESGSGPAPESTPASDQPVASIPATTSDMTQDAFAPPFPENIDFFSPQILESIEQPPVPAIAAVESAAEELAKLDLLIIGFVQVEGESPKAMLHLNGKLEIVAAGELLGDLEIVGVDEPRVSVRHANQQLEFALCHQSPAGVSVAQEQRSQSPSRRRGAWSQNGNRGADDTDGRLPIPVDFAALPTMPLPPLVDLPQINQPDLPQIEAVPR
ncbi:hypothetical protein GC176_21540 [bacterium]|nr:hypothetical protein [bacterium]